jgi:hypothetical protein
MTLKELEKITVGKLKTCESSRDHATYTNVLLGINRQLEGQAEEKWWKQLRELKESFEALEEFDIDRYESVFEKKKKTLLLA